MQTTLNYVMLSREQLGRIYSPPPTHPRGMRILDFSENEGDIARKITLQIYFLSAAAAESLESFMRDKKVTVNLKKQRLIKSRAESKVSPCT